MDWYAWLSKAGLAPAATYEYGLLFSENELEPADAPDFDHDLLKSMGVAVAKHRLEILKLARPGRRLSSSAASASLSRILAAVDRVARYVRALVRRRGESSSVALVLVPSQHQPDGVNVGRVSSSSGHCTAPKRTRSKPKSATAAAPRSAYPGGGFRGGATVHAMGDVESGGEETVKWDCMFQDLNPN